jgi:hypothetical protein
MTTSTNRSRGNIGTEDPVGDAARLASVVILPLLAFSLVFVALVSTGKSLAVAWTASAFSGVGCYRLVARLFFSRAIHVRGQQLWAVRDASKNVEAEWRLLERSTGQKGDRCAGLYWGGLAIPPPLAIRNFCYVGQVRSGKSTLMTLLMQTALRTVGREVDHRAVVYNPAGEAYAQLQTVDTEASILNLNPFDARSHPWDIAADVTSPSASLAVSSILITDRGRESNPFFTHATRLLLSAVLDVFHIQAPGVWTFADVCRVMRDKDKIRNVLDQTAETRHVLKNIEVQETLGNIMTTIWSYMKPYDIIAALWEKAGLEPISLRAWMEDRVGSILLLGRNHKAPEAGDALNRAILRRLNQILQDQEPSHTRRTWFFLDEITQVKFDELADMATNAAKYGGCIVLGLQDISRMRSVYGRDDADAILGQMTFKTLLRCDSPETQTWCAEVIGKEELVESSSTKARGGKSITRTPREKPVVMPSEFGTLPVADFERGISGWFTSAVTGPFGHPEHRIAGAFLRGAFAHKREAEPEILPREESDEQLRSEWAESDAQRLRGLKLDYRLEENTQRFTRDMDRLPDLEGAHVVSRPHCLLD